MGIKIIKKNIMIFIINFIITGLLCIPILDLGKKYFLVMFVGFNVLVNLLIYLKNSYDIFHKYRYLISFLIFIILVVFKIHGSSIAAWNENITDRIKPSTDVLIGKARLLRTDEWLVQTPFYLSQYSSDVNFNKVNKNIRSDGEDVLISNYAPSKDISNIGKPFNWGFLFLDQERGLSWYWCSKAILLFLLSYELIMFLIGGNKKVSFLAAMYLTLSPPMQWWFSTMVVDLIIMAQGIIVSFIYFVKAKEKTKKVLSTTLISIFSIGFILSLYPPIQVPLGYIILIFFSYILFANYKELKKSDVIYVVTAIIAIAGIVGFSLFNSLDAINMVMSTVYPGRRIATGGGYLFDNLSFFIANPLLPYKRTTILNACELSSFIVIFPVILLFPYLIYKRKVKNKGLAVTLYLFFIFQFSWLFVKYPAIVGKLTLFSYVPEFRTILILGLTGVYLTIILISTLMKTPLNKIEASIITVITALLILYEGTNSILNQYIGLQELIIITLAFVMFTYALLRGLKKVVLSLLIIITLVSGATINPIARGLGPLKDKVVYNKIQEINKEESGGWVALGDDLLGNLLIACGVKTINGVQYYPDLDLWHKLDPEKKYESIYNRYSHVRVSIVNDKTTFELVGDDSFQLKINYAQLGILNAKYIITKDSIEELNKNKTFEKIYYNSVDKITIYKYVG